MDIKEQAAIIKRGVSGITPEGGLELKLEKSIKAGKPLKIKLGLDPTAPDIHLGSAVVLRKLRQFQDLGHKVVIIIGDFTGMIGDPSGKSETRKQLTPEEVKINAATYEAQYHKILDPDRTEVRFNSEWHGKLTFYDVIKLAAKTTVARIMERDDFTTRFREGRTIGLHELVYPLCQAYDSVILESDVEMGGTDQMFNIMTGRDLQTQYGQEPQIALFMPLLVGLDGSMKMSKSLGNYVGITETPDVMFGKLMSITDAMMPSYFELCTDVPMQEVRSICMQATSGEINPKDVKRRLAREIITLYHDSKQAEHADAEFERIHAHREQPDDITPIQLPPDAIKEGKVWICRLLVCSGLAKGTGDARRLIAQGGVRVAGEKVSDSKTEYDHSSLQDVVIQVGNRHFIRVKL